MADPKLPVGWDPNSTQPSTLDGSQLSFADAISDADAELWWNAAHESGGWCKRGGGAHEWVDVGFQFSKFVCKHCNLERSSPKA